MAGEKSFWKRYEFLIIAVATFVLIYMIIFFNQKINFFLGNELIVYLSPLQKSFDMNYGNVSRIDFDVYAENPANCRASCTYSFYDRSRADAIDNGSFILENKKHFRKSYDIRARRVGSGQDIYNFEIRCKNQRSFTCLTDSGEKLRSSFITVNYHLTETEARLKQELKLNITRLLEKLAHIDVLRQETGRKYYDLGFRINLVNLSGQKTVIDDEFDAIRIYAENLRTFWFSESYIKLSQLYNESHSRALDGIGIAIKNLNESVHSTLALHNVLSGDLAALKNELDNLGLIAAAINDGKIIIALDGNITMFNEAAASFTNNTFSNYSFMAGEIEKMKINERALAETARNYSIQLFFDVDYQLDYENSFVCTLYGNCSSMVSINGTIANSIEFSSGYPDAHLLGKNCDEAGKLNDAYARIANESIKKIEEQKIIFPATKEFEAAAEDYKNNITRIINNSYLASFLALKNVPEYMMKVAAGKMPAAMAEESLASYEMSLYILSRLKPSDDTYKIMEKCSRLETGKKTDIFMLDSVALPPGYSITSNIDQTLSDNPPICCVFNDCKPCCSDDSCRNDPKTFPVIFLHGHSFSKDNSPEYSLDAFNKLQSRLEEDGYINAGIVSLYSKNEKAERGIWGLSGKPVTVKASYYYDAFRKDGEYIIVPTKSENIDTYALRLKDIIEIVKERTGRPKIIIIAHSMGGLVARRYMQIFGDDNVNKLVMIATPNKGISGRIGDYCWVVGENRECMDMQEGSIFLSKLNDPANQPSGAKMYAVIGLGCGMKTGDGDGVVLAQNAAIENTELYYINGTCSQLSTLHTEILDTDKYDEMYRIATEALKE